MSILLFGSSGMIGSEVTKYFKLQGEDVITPKKIEFSEIRDLANLPNLKKLEALLQSEKPHFILNLAGKTRHRITQKEDEVDAILVNVLFSTMLDEIACKASIPIFTVATDCVFSGNDGSYNENSVKDGDDIYAITKIAGEASTRATNHLRVSVVGLGNKNGNSLAEWFYNLPINSKIDGYANHYWNGVPSRVLGKVFYEIYRNKIEIPKDFHLATEGKMSKFEILCIFRDIFKRTDIEIQEIQTPKVVDRSLTTVHESLNEDIWKICGFERVPSSELLLRKYFQ
jgi:dTDP-4-dehydrorhamnose reductase